MDLDVIRSAPPLFNHSGAPLKRLPQTVADGNLWYTIASDHLVSDAFIDAIREWI